MRILRVVLVLLVAAAALGAIAQARWRRRVDALGASLDTTETRRPPANSAPLPEPVAQFFATAIRPGTADARSVELDTAGEFLMAPGPNGWKPFHAHQRFNAVTPGFVWDARIAMAPFVPVFVRDAYVNGRGEMVARILGVYAVANESGSAGLAEGQLMRFLAEMMWFPSALRPENGVIWTAIDSRRASASLTDAGHTVSLEVTFNDAHEIVEVFAPARMRAVDGRHEPTPWAVRCWDNQERGGFRIPMACEAQWRLADGPLAYWRGRVTNIRFTP